MCLPSLAAAQQQPAQERGDGTWEFSVGAGIKIMDRALLGQLAGGTPTTRFTTTATPNRLMPGIALRLGYNFNRHLGVSAGVEGAKGAGVNYVTPFGALTWTGNLNAKTSPFITLGTQLTRIAGNNGRRMHPSWGGHLGVGVRSMISDQLALRIEGRMAAEHYQDLPGSKSAYNSFATIGLSYLWGGRARPVARPVQACPACVPQRARVDTIVRGRVDTVRVTRVDTVRITEPSPDQLVLRVQFITDSTSILRRSRPLLDTIARAILATPGSAWEVQGHTDSVGSSERNRALAQGRAQAVVDYLVLRGVPRASLSAVGYGEDRPVVSNDTVEGRAQNRRVQLRRRPAGPPSGAPVP